MALFSHCLGTAQLESGGNHRWDQRSLCCVVRSPLWLLFLSAGADALTCHVDFANKRKARTLRAWLWKQSCVNYCYIYELSSADCI